ncbi:permease [uncultured Gimesia sp.]|uniref:permease n=1 Tax=uncultured Gimesia sp. TaxID=1678688 RepID=UPI0030DB43BE|tara:strand:+ start:74370 stop:75908 length:1539 start_codon:yes stop_codon:yes gene_type:complete
MIEYIFWGFALRFVQCLLEAAPFILAGLFIAAIFQRFFGSAETRRFFGEGTKSALLRAWGIGMLLPVCSLGVIPVARELKKAGLAGGTIIAFAMSAPLFNPLSLLYGLTLSEPVTILAFAFFSLLIVTLVGTIWDRLFPEKTEVPADDQAIPYGIKRIVSVGFSAAKEASGASLIYILIGLAGVALLGVLLPQSSLQRSVNYDNPYAPLLMTGVAIPVYATPMLAMSQLGSMFQHANSVGAAFILLVLGAGVNLGLVTWIIRNYNWKKALVWFSLLLLIIVGLAYGVEKPLFPTHIEPADHTHAFDIYCQPFSKGTSNFYQTTKEKLGHVIDPYEIYSAIILVSMILVGFVLRFFDRDSRIETWLKKTEPVRSSKYDIVLPGPVLGLLILVGLIISSGVGCFSFYPAPDVVCEEMTIAKTEALSGALSGNKSHSKYWIEIYDDWTRKLEVGVYLRKLNLSEYHHWKAQLLREKLELLEHEIEDEEHEEVRRLVSDIHHTHRRMVDAYLRDLN